MRSPSNTTWLSSEALYNSHTLARLTNVLGEPVSNHSQIGTNYVIIWSGQGHRASLLFYSRYVTYLNDCFFIYVYVYFVLIMCKQYELIRIWRYNLNVRGDILSKTLVRLYYALLTWSPRQRDDTSYLKQCPCISENEYFEFWKCGTINQWNKKVYTNGKYSTMSSKFIC